jgi:hypothetical protein
MFAKEKSGLAVMQYVDDGSVRVSVDSMALDKAAAASGFVGTFAPHAIATSDSVAASRRTLIRPVIDIGHPDYTRPALGLMAMPHIVSATDRPPDPACESCGASLLYVETEISSGAFRTQAASMPQIQIHFYDCPDCGTCWKLGTA